MVRTFLTLAISTLLLAPATALASDGASLSAVEPLVSAAASVGLDARPLVAELRQAVKDVLPQVERAPADAVERGPEQPVGRMVVSLPVVRF